MGESETAPLAEPPRYRRFQAPQQQGGVLCDPAGHLLPKLLRANRAASASGEMPIAGIPLTQLTHEARRHLLDAAYRYMSAFCDVPKPDRDAHRGPVVASGHQPELFHPGVWLKNFALARLADNAEGVGVHLLIDSDLCRTAAIRTLAGSVDAPRIESVAYDQTTHAMPHEERGVVDHETLATFGPRIGRAIEGLIANPLAESMTPDLVAAARSTGNLGQTLSHARRLMEGRWGCQTLELPMSAVCDSPPFAWFVAAMLADPPKLHSAYNAALADYRTAHGIRNAAQPMPDLQAADDWLETPLWVWREEQPTRQPLFVRRVGDQLWLTDRTTHEWSAPAQPAEFAQRVAELRASGVKIRSRALLTTLYARLVLCDLFVHGIGGAKYDEATDHFCENLWGFTPPPHATISGTLRLPIDRPSFDPDKPRRLQASLREMRYHPERFIDSPTAEARRLIEQKQQAYRTPKTHQNACDRHAAIVAANERLAAVVEPLRRDMLAEYDAAKSRLGSERLLASREYSFCLFPDDWLREQMGAMTGAATNPAAT